MLLKIATANLQTTKESTFSHFPIFVTNYKIKLTIKFADPSFGKFSMDLFLLMMKL